MLVRRAFYGMVTTEGVKNMKSVVHFACVLLMVGCVQNLSMGQVIDFETFPDGTIPSDGQVISDQYEAVFGITFSLEDGTSPVIAKAGPPQTAFAGFGGPDMPRPDINAGQMFLTDDGNVGAPPSPLIIDYSSPVSQASGIIIDIDFSEQWTIEAYDAKDVLITSIALGAIGNGTGSPWIFTLPEPIIHRIRIRFTGSGGSIGLAFDNFSPAAGFGPLTVDIESEGACDTICDTSSAELVAALTGGIPPYTFDWQELVGEDVWSSIGSDPTIVVAPESSATYRVVIADDKLETVTSDPYLLTVCESTPVFDADQDGDVDLADFGLFQIAFTGPEG